MGLLLFHADVLNCWSLGTSVQGVDSKVGEMIYVLWRVDLMKFMQNEPIPIRNTWEIHENSKKC